MGYFTHVDNTQSYRPDNDENTLYIESVGLASFAELCERIKDHFGDYPLHLLDIRAEHIHTDCVGYDLYDRGDYTDYIVIEKL
mgnify:CR=1 FL=1